MNSNARIQIIALFMVLSILFFASTEPLIFSIFVGIVVVAFLIIQRGLVPFLNSLDHDEYRTRKRKEALREAKIFLAPYNDIWRDLRLSNKYCYLSLELDGVSIIGKEIGAPYRKFRVISSPIHEYSDLWEMFCKAFSHNVTYSGLLEMCRKFGVSVYEYSIKSIDNSKPFANNISSINKDGAIALGTTKKNVEKVEKLDINNCSEVELTALPGISIVMAKKAIRKREEICGFKTIEDFFIFMRLKPHMENQLRERICVKKMKGAKKKIERNQERSIDL